MLSLMVKVTCKTMGSKNSGMLTRNAANSNPKIQLRARQGKRFESSWALM